MAGSATGCGEAVCGRELHPLKSKRLSRRTFRELLWLLLEILPLGFEAGQPSIRHGATSRAV